jgi:protein-tyrosine phosphatase
MAGMSAIRVVFVCLGNICRSPMAKGLFQSKLQERGLGASFYVESAATSSYHVGDRPDPGSIRVARNVGIDISGDRSQQMTRSDMSRFDYVIAMDRSNYRNLVDLDPQEEQKIHLLRSFESDAEDLNVPDPWGGGNRGFEIMYDIIDRAVDGFLDHLVQEHALE